MLDDDVRGRGPRAGRAAGRRAEAPVRLRHGRRSADAIVNPVITETTRRVDLRRGLPVGARALLPRSPARTSAPHRLRPRRQRDRRSRPTSSWPACSSTSSTTSTACCCSSTSTTTQRKEALRELRERVLSGEPPPRRRRRGSPELKLVFLGTPDAAVPPLEPSSTPATTIALVVSQPDKRRGRGGGRRRRAR